MAGTLVLTTLSDGTNSTSATNCIQGSAKAWVNFNGGLSGTPGEIFSAYNVSSVTYVTTGTFTINFTSAMPSTNYAFVTGSEYYPSANALIVATANARTTSSITVNVNYVNATVFNTNRVSVAILNS